MKRSWKIKFLSLTSGTVLDGCRKRLWGDAATDVYRLGTTGVIESSNWRRSSSLLTEIGQSAAVAACRVFKRELLFVRQVGRYSGLQLHVPISMSGFVMCRDWEMECNFSRQNWQYLTLSIQAVDVMSVEVWLDVMSNTSRSVNSCFCVSVPSVMRSIRLWKHWAKSTFTAFLTLMTTVSFLVLSRRSQRFGGNFSRLKAGVGTSSLCPGTLCSNTYFISPVVRDTLQLDGQNPLRNVHYRPLFVLHHPRSKHYCPLSLFYWREFRLSGFLKLTISMYASAIMPSVAKWSVSSERPAIIMSAPLLDGMDLGLPCACTERTCGECNIKLELQHWGTLIDFVRGAHHLKSRWKS